MAEKKRRTNENMKQTGNGRTSGARRPREGANNTQRHPSSGGRGRRPSGGGSAGPRSRQNSGQAPRQNRRPYLADENPAKSVGGPYRGRRRPEEPDHRMSKTIGFILTGAQAIVTLVFMVSVFMLGVLPSKYLMVLGVVLFLALLIVAGSQFLSKKRGIAGKVYSIFMSVIMIIGSYYMFKTGGMLEKISGGNMMVDKMVVAVSADDPAESIQDAASYTFGVQYALKGEQVRETLDAVNAELGSSVSVTEYQSVQEQATALQAGEIQAMVYNEAYNSVLDETIENFSSSVKVIYTYSIESEVDNQAAEVEVDNECFTVYISGIDVYGPIETNSRSDVNILMAVNPTTHQILQITTPRDTYVPIPGISGGERDKLTHAGIYGVDRSMATLSELYETDIQFYARVNFTSLVTMVNALGGVDVNSEQSFSTNNGLYVQQGMNHFNGEQALEFARERYHVDGGDFQRGKNQQAVITAMIQKAVSPAILMGANGIMNSVAGNVDTNMSQEQIQMLIKAQLNEGAAWNIKSMALEVSGDQQYAYSMPGTMLYVAWPDEASVAVIKAAIDSLERGEILDNTETVQ